MIYKKNKKFFHSNSNFALQPGLGIALGFLSKSLVFVSERVILSRKIVTHSRHSFAPSLQKSEVSALLFKKEPWSKE